MTTAYRPIRIALEHHVAGKGNTQAAHNLDDRKERAILATDDVAEQPVSLPKEKQNKLLISIEDLRAAIRAREEY